jgi:exodeoxyribonuclease-3
MSGFFLRCPRSRCSASYASPPPFHSLPQERFPEAHDTRCGVWGRWHGQKSWNGVAILARGREPVERRCALPGDPEDLHSRYIEASVGDIVVGCLYLPTGNPAPAPKFDYELRWFDRLMAHVSQLLASEAPAVIASDYNVIPTDLDVYAPERWKDDALFRPEVREAYRRLLALGWVDAVHTMHPGKRVYTFWKYLRNAFEWDAGLRIDHLLLSPSLATRLTHAAVDRDIRAREKASDHAPVWITVGGVGCHGVSLCTPSHAP